MIVTSNVAGQTNTTLTLDTGFNGVVRLRARNSNSALGSTIIRSGILEINDALADEPKPYLRIYPEKDDTHRMAEANKAFSHFRF